jgi:tetratricopeptide (TPR) repeat protein
MLVLAFSAAALAQGPFETGLKEFQDEGYEEALPLFLEAKRAEPGSAQIAYYIGLTYKNLEEMAKAIPYFREASTLTPPVPEALVELIDALYVTDQLAEAKRWIERAEKENVQPARIQFLKGLVLMKEGKNFDAAAAFKKSKEINANIAQAAEFKMADTYLQEGKIKESRDLFVSSALHDPTTNLGGFAREYDKLVADKVTQERSWSVFAGLYYLYDSNVVAKPTSGPGADFITGQADFALATAVNISYIAPFSFSTPWTLAFQYALGAERYFRRDDYNNMTQALSIVPGYNFPMVSLTAPIFGSYYWLQLDKGTDFLNSPSSWLSDSKYSRFLGTNPTMRFLVNDNNVGEVSFRYMKKSYFVPVYDPDEDRDGENIAGSLGWMYLFNQGKGLVSFRYTRARENTDGRNWAYDQDDFQASLVYPITDRLRFQVYGDAAYTRYRDVNTVFDMKRRNDTYNVLASLSYNFIDGLYAVGQYAYTRDKCNIAIYDYSRNIVSLGIEYRY